MLGSLILDLFEINCFYLEPFLIPRLLESVFCCHRQTYVSVLIRQSIFPCVKYFSLQSKVIMPNCIVFLNSLRLQIVHSLLEMLEIPFFEVHTIKWKTFVPCELFLSLNDSSEVREQLGQVVKLNLFLYFLVIPCDFKASEYLLLYILLSFQFQLYGFL